MVCSRWNWSAPSGKGATACPSPGAVCQYVLLCDTACHLMCTPTKFTVAGIALRGCLHCGSTCSWLRFQPHLLVCMTTKFAKPTAAGALPHCEHTDDEAATVGSMPLPSCVDSGLPMAGSCSVCMHPHLWPQATLWALWAMSMQPNRVLSLGLSAEPEFQHPVLHTPAAVSAARKCGNMARTICFGLSLPCGAAGQLLHSPLEPLKLPICLGGPPSC